MKIPVEYLVDGERFRDSQDKIYTFVRQTLCTIFAIRDDGTIIPVPNGTEVEPIPSEINTEECSEL